MNAFPDIPLTAVNAVAARLLSSGSGANVEQTEQFQADLLKTLGEIDTAIASITGQLETRTDDDQWRKAAKRALRGYQLKRDTINRFMKSANALLHFLNAHNARLKKTAGRESHDRAVEAKARRIASARNEDRLFLDTLKSLLKERLTPDAYQVLMVEVSAKLNSENKPS